MGHFLAKYLRKKSTQDLRSTTTILRVNFSLSGEQGARELSQFDKLKRSTWWFAASFGQRECSRWGLRTIRISSLASGLAEG